MRVALRRSDRHPGGGRDLLEREAEGVLQHEDTCLRLRQPGEAHAQLGSQLRELGFEVGRPARRNAGVLVERGVAACTSTLRDVPAGVQRQPVEPGGERRFAAELPDLDAEPRERILRCVVGVLGVSENVGGKTTDTGSVAGAQRLEGAGVSVFGTSHENRVAESVVPGLGLGPQGGTDSAALAQGRLHPASLLAGGRFTTGGCNSGGVIR